jgi:molybdate transport system substrate-binding protein
MNYTVQPGDTMFLIAQKYGIDLNTLIAANPQLENPDLIYAGQVINLPGAHGAPGATGAPVSSGPVGLTIYAAASLKDALEELKSIYTRQHPNVNITYNFGASGVLQKQIEQGAPADLFISAGKSEMDVLAREGLLQESSRKDLLGNELVLIAGKNRTLIGFEGLTSPTVSRVSIGAPETVPAGRYAKETLTNLNLWGRVQPKIVLANDVRQVLANVESGYADAGLVYRTDALVGKNINVVAVAPAGSHSSIIYPMAVIKSTKHPMEAGAFAAFLSSDQAAQVFSKYGFTNLK